MYSLITAGAEDRPAVALARAQPDSARRASVYDVSANHTRIRNVGGETVLELSDGVTIIHEDVKITCRRGINHSGTQVTHLIGDVVIYQQTITMWGDEGEYRQPADLAILRKNVRVVDRGMEVTCDEARYSRATGRAWLIGNVVGRDSASTLYADSLFYDRETVMTEVFGNVKITNFDEGFTVKGRHGYYFRERGEAVIDREPRLIVDPESAEPVTIVSDTMRIFPDAEHAVAYNTVKILKGTTVTQCDSAVLYDADKRAELYGQPLAKQKNVSMAGDMMALFYDDEEVNKIDIRGNAAIREAQLDSFVVGRESWIKGDTMSLYLRDNRVDSIRVLRNATSEYYPVNKKKVESNFVRGDSMYFRFKGDSLEYVRITGRADGIYKYVDLKTGQTGDSLRAAADTNLTYVSFAKNAERVVYSAKEIEYYTITQDLVLRKSAKVIYQDRTLFGDEITYFARLQMMDARGSPKLEDAGETFYGDRMDYDLEAGSGLVNLGSTRFGEGYYFGDNVAKVGENEMKVWNSTYTTCDLKVPHFHFAAKEMKVYPKDKVVSGPIWLHVGKTPIAYLPFMANSIRRGRRSGILRPEFEFGITKQTGRYVRGFGYYWATNDYTDMTFTGHFNEESSFNIHMQNRYSLRYRFSGNVDFDFYRNLQTFLNEWKFDARHNHTLGENFTLASDLHFVSSDKGVRAISAVDDVERIIDRSLRSTVSVSKRWNTVGFSASATRQQKLDVTDPNVVRVETTFPSVNLSIPSRNLYFGKKSKSGDASLAEKILGGIRYSPGVSGSRNVKEKEFELTERITSQQSLSFQSPQKIMFFNVSPSLSTRNSYTRNDTVVKAHTINDTTVVPSSHTVEDDNQFSWNTGVGMNTKLYGTFYPEIGRLRGIRHTVTPSVNYTYTPKLGNRSSSERFSVNLTNTLDLKIAAPKRKQNGTGGPESKNALRGDAGSPGAASRGASGGAGAPADTTAAEEEQLQRLSNVIIWSLSSSYDPDAPKDEGWSTVSSRVNLKLFGTSISMNQTFDPYERELLSTGISTGFSFNGTHPFGRAETTEEAELNVVAAADTTSKSERGATYEVTTTSGEGMEEQAEKPAAREGWLPWSLNADMSYNKFGDRDAEATVNLRTSLDLTPAWRISYWTSYDIESRAFRGQNFSITRDLHCWEMSFSRQLLGSEWQYYFKINLRAHPEIYAENGRRGLGGVGARGIMSGSYFQ